MSRRSGTADKSAPWQANGVLALVILPGLAFLLEVAMLASLVFWGFKQTEPYNYLLGIGLPAVVVVLWGLFMAPKSQRRLPLHVVKALALIAFLLAACALFSAGLQTLAIIFAAVAVVWYICGLVAR